MTREVSNELSFTRSTTFNEKVPHHARVLDGRLRTLMQISTRFAVGVCVVLLASACSNPVSPLTAPTQTTAAPTATISGPALLAGTYTVAGAVSEGARPIEGANISAWIDQGSSGYSYMWAHGPLLTDAAGRYQLTGLPPQVKVWLQAWKTGYVQQCAAPQVTLLGDTRVDVQLVAQANLSASTVQTPGAGFRSVSGVIFEVIGAGKQPVAGAFVDFEPLMDFPAATTVSDTAGRYLLCGVPEGQAGDIGAGLGARVAYVSVPSGQSTGIDITLPYLLGGLR
jgi:hypothetical protein